MARAIGHEFAARAKCNQKFTKAMAAGIVGSAHRSSMEAGLKMEARTLHCDVEKTGDQATGRVITVTCHGQLVAGTSGTIKDVVKPLIADGGRIILDFNDVDYVDSMGLGALVGLKVSAIGAGYCTLEFINLSKRVQELLRLTNLTELFKS